MSEVYFVDILLAISRPAAILSRKGTRKREVMRRFEVSLPVTDIVRAEQMMDHFAKQLVDVFKEVEERDKSRREAAEAIGDDGRRELVGSGDNGQIAEFEAASNTGPVSEGRDTVGEPVSTDSDAESG